MSVWNKIFSSKFRGPKPSTYPIVKGMIIFDLGNRLTLNMLKVFSYVFHFILPGDDFYTYIFFFFSINVCIVPILLSDFIKKKKKKKRNKISHYLLDLKRKKSFKPSQMNCIYVSYLSRRRIVLNHCVTHYFIHIFSLIRNQDM